MAKFKIKLNDTNTIVDLLQMAFKLSEEQIVQAQNEINKLASSTRLQDEIMDAKAKYAKAINDYMSMKDKAISKKIEIAKLLTEIYKHNGNVNDTLNDATSMKGLSFDFSKIREMVNNDTSKDNDKEIIKLKG
jgi:ribosomal protein S15P/S13E